MASNSVCPFGGDGEEYTSFLDELYEVCCVLTNHLSDNDVEKLLALNKLHLRLRECQFSWDTDRHVRGFLEPRRALLAVRHQLDLCFGVESDVQSDVPVIKQAVCLDALRLFKTPSAPFSNIRFLGNHERNFMELLDVVELEIAVIQRRQAGLAPVAAAAGAPAPVAAAVALAPVVVFPQAPNLTVRSTPWNTLRLRRWCWALMEMVMANHHEYVRNASKRRAEEEPEGDCSAEKRRRFPE